MLIYHNISLLFLFSGKLGVHIKSHLYEYPKAKSVQELSVNGKTTITVL